MVPSKELRGALHTTGKRERGRGPFEDQTFWSHVKLGASSEAVAALQWDDSPLGQEREGDGSTATKGISLGTGVTDCQAVKCCCVTEWLMAVLPTAGAKPVRVLGGHGGLVVAVLGDR